MRYAFISIKTTLKAFYFDINKLTEESIDKKKGQFMTFSLIFCSLLSALDNKILVRDQWLTGMILEKFIILRQIIIEE